MESIIDFVGRLSDVVKEQFQETKGCIGKDIIDTTAGRKGVCVDRITNFYGTRISFLGLKYEKDELKEIEETDEDMLVCQGKDSKFMIPMSQVSAIGKDIILLKSELRHPELDIDSVKKDTLFKRFFLTKEAVKDILPNSVSATGEAEGKKWLKKIIGD